MLCKCGRGLEEGRATIGSARVSTFRGEEKRPCSRTVCREESRCCMCHAAPQSQQWLSEVAVRSLGGGATWSHDGSTEENKPRERSYAREIRMESCIPVDGAATERSLGWPLDSGRRRK